MGDEATKAGDFDQAVAYYRTAVQSAPDNPNYKIALQRAMLAASRVHFERGREFEKNDQLEAARSEYKLTSEYDPQNAYASGMVATLDQLIRNRVEASRPRPLDQLREQARAAAPLPLLNPTTDRVSLHFTGTRVGDVLNTIANASGINVTFDAQANINGPITIQIDDLSVEQALNMVLSMSQNSYKVINQRSVFIFPDTLQKHGVYDDQVVQIFYVANADVTELAQLLSQIVRFNGIAIQPVISANARANTITARSTPAVMQIIERIIQQNDKPRAEIVFDIEILEVDRERVKQYGLNLTEYAIGGIFSPEVSPGATTTAGTGTAGSSTTGASAAPGSVQSPPAFNLNTISRGFSTTDFYLAVPAAIVRFLESDSRTKLVAKPQVRGADGNKITVNLGQQVPIVSTSYTPIAAGGAGVNPLNSFNLKDVGINVELTPRVTTEGDVSVELTIESSAQGPDQNVAGANYPSFFRRTVTTRLRLRDGESNLLAGLLREDEANGVRGVPGAINVPVFRQLFSGNTQAFRQTDLVMLLTPHIIRTSEITVADLQPIFIGSQQNFGLGGPPPLIAAPEAQAAPQTTPAPAPSFTQPNTVPGGVIVAPPPGSTPVPGTVVVPPNQAAAPAPAAPPAPPSAAPVEQPQTPAPQAAQSAAPPTPQAPGAASATTGQPIETTVGSARVIVTPPGTIFRVGGGPARCRFRSLTRRA